MFGRARAFEYQRENRASSSAIPNEDVGGQGRVWQYFKNQYFFCLNIYTIYLYEYMCASSYQTSDETSFHNSDMDKAWCHYESEGVWIRCCFS